MLNQSAATGKREFNVVKCYKQSINSCIGIFDGILLLLFTFIVYFHDFQLQLFSLETEGCKIAIEGFLSLGLTRFQARFFCTT